jgi:hypothetical protein
MKALPARKRRMNEIQLERGAPAHISLEHRIRTSTNFGFSMQTPRPDHFSYPHGYPEHKTRPWMRAVFVAALAGAFALGLVLTLAG